MIKKWKLYGFLSVLLLVIGDLCFTSFKQYEQISPERAARIAVVTEKSFDSRQLDSWRVILRLIAKYQEAYDRSQACSHMYSTQYFENYKQSLEVIRNDLVDYIGFKLKKD